MDFFFNEPTICYQQETHFKYKDIDRLKVKTWSKIYPVHIKIERKW